MQAGRYNDGRSLAKMKLEGICMAMYPGNKIAIASPNSVVVMFNDVCMPITLAAAMVFYPIRISCLATDGTSHRTHTVEVVEDEHEPRHSYEPEVCFPSDLFDCRLKFLLAHGLSWVQTVGFGLVVLLSRSAIFNARDSQFRKVDRCGFGILLNCHGEKSYWEQVCCHEDVWLDKRPG
jgi:hypothetical protein